VKLSFPKIAAIILSIAALSVLVAHVSAASATSATPERINGCEVLVVGGGAGGFAAGMQSARMGTDTCILEETDWLGGMLTSAGVGAIDGAKIDGVSNSIFGEMRDLIERKYSPEIDRTRLCTVSYFCFEPSVGKKVLEEMAAKEDHLEIFYKTRVTKVYKENDKIIGVKAKNTQGETFLIPAHITIDATEYGDILELSGTPYDIGPDEDSGEPLNKKIEKCVQPLTQVMILKNYGEDVTIKKPKNYDKKNYICSVKNKSCWSAKFTFDELVLYGLMPNGKIMINWPQNNWGNDFDAYSDKHEGLTRKEILEKAKDHSRGFLYFIQTELGHNTYGMYNEFGTPDRFPKIPYVRESRRLKGVERLMEQDITPDQRITRPLGVVEDAIAVGDYPIDIHFCSQKSHVYKKTHAFQIPYGVIVPEKMDGLLAAEKNISVSHIANGATRLQPTVMSVGQAAGAAASISAQHNIQPRDVDIEELQKALLDSGNMLFYYKDIKADHYAFEEINKLSLEKVLRGTKDLFFEPKKILTRADVLRIAIASRKEPWPPIKTEISKEIFADLPDLEENPYVKIGLDQGLISGHKAANGNYEININKTATRAETIKIFLQASDYKPLDTADSSFQDVEGWSIGWIEKAKELGVVEGREGGDFQPKRTVSKAEAARMLTKILELKSEQKSK
jgi:hypothetical protein